MTSPDCKSLGAFYTPAHLAEWLAEEILAAAVSANVKINSIVDPACGDGALLRAIGNLTKERITLNGIDIDPVAVKHSSTTLGPASNIILADALNPDCRWGRTRPNAVISNPPWGATLPNDRQFYRQCGYHLATGQFDISDLFVERAFTTASPGGVLGFILPDSVVHPDHRTLRELFLEHTIVLLARLGEGVFQGVYRSTVVVVARKGTAPPKHLVECLQIPANHRGLLLKGSVSFKNMKNLYSHYVPQARFKCNSLSVFNVTQTEEDYDISQKFSSLPAFDWSRRVRISRGIEIGKHGVTISCATCGNHRAAPARRRPTLCSACASLIPDDAPKHRIISKYSVGSGWHPLIVGEDVDRYTASSRRYIKLGVRGIRYKPMDQFASKKLLVRKTGVGLRAAIDKSGSATIQTVFHVVMNRQQDDWLLDYLQGVINSRPLLAWYLRWSGENQWRSHPYVTPKVLKQLPIPDPLSDCRIEGLARKIAEESRLARDGIVDSEHLVDELVCRVYDLDAKSLSWVNDVLADTDNQLDYFKRMRNGAADVSFDRIRKTREVLAV